MRFSNSLQGGYTRRIVLRLPQLAGAGPVAQLPDWPREEAETSGVFEYWQLLRRRKGTIVVIAFLGALAGLLVTLPMPPVYQGRSTLEIQPLNEDFLHIREADPVSAGGGYAPEYDLQTQVRILQSDALLTRVVDTLKLPQRLMSGAVPRARTWRSMLGLGSAPQREITREAARAIIAANLRVRAQPNTRIIEITLDATEPRLAADVVNAIAAQFVEWNIRARWEASQRTGEWLSTQLADLRIKLERSEEQAQAYARASGLIFTGGNDNVAEQKLRQLQEELSRAQADRIARQSRYELALRTSPDSLGEVIDSAVLREFQGKLADLRRELAEGTTTLTASHPKVKKVQAQVASLEAAIGQERKNIVERIRSDFESAQRRENLLAADYQAQSRQMTEQVAKVAHYSLLKREAETTRQLYENMFQRVKEAGVASALRATNIRVIDAAEVPKRPYKPRPIVNTVVGLFSGILLGMTFAIVRERMDRCIQDPGDTQTYLNVAEIGVIPAIHSEPAGRRSLLGAALRHRQPACRSLISAPAALPERFELVAWQRGMSISAESFRSALTSILFAQDSSAPRVLLVSSANPSEGKSIVTSNLAIAIAETGRRVLLIDADMRRPRMHEIFAIPNTPGLADLLQQQTSLERANVAVPVHESPIPNLFVLPAGTTEMTASLIHSLRWRELLERLRREFDFILIDSPPVLQIADARVLAQFADAVILVVRAQHTTRDSLGLACERFTRDGTAILGTILTDWRPENTGAYGYSGYYDWYRHYYGRKRDAAK